MPLRAAEAVSYSLVRRGSRSFPEGTTCHLPRPPVARLVLRGLLCEEGSARSVP